MTVKQLMGVYDNEHRGLITITDESKSVVYESDVGTFEFEDSFELHADLFGKYEEFMAYIYRLKVLYFSAGDGWLWIHAEAREAR